MLKISLSLGVLLGASLGLAALPPLSENMRKYMAEEIFEGEVLKVETEIKQEGGLEHQNRVFKADILVSKIDKGQEDLSVGDTVKLNYWKPAKRPRGWTGSQGQNSLPQVGDKGRFYSHTLSLLNPNGWDRTQAGQPDSYMENTADDDDIEWYDADVNEDALGDL